MTTRLPLERQVPKKFSGWSHVTHSMTTRLGQAWHVKTRIQSCDFQQHNQQVSPNTTYIYEIVRIKSCDSHHDYQASPSAVVVWGRNGIGLKSLAFWPSDRLSITYPYKCPYKTKSPNKKHAYLLSLEYFIFYDNFRTSLMMFLCCNLSTYNGAQITMLYIPYKCCENILEIYLIKHFSFSI